MPGRSSPACASPNASTRSAPDPRSAPSPTATKRARETTNRLSKTELVHGPDATGWGDVDELELATLSWVHWFNEDRLNAHCDDVPPAEFWSWRRSRCCAGVMTTLDEGPRPTLTAIVPCNDLDQSEAFYRRLGFERDDGDDDPHSEYRMLTDGHGATVHLTDAVEGWVVPGRNPFGLYLYTPDVDARAVPMRNDIIEPGRAPEHKEWGMYEFSLSDPDGVLVRVGWPSRLVTD